MNLKQRVLLYIVWLPTGARRDPLAILLTFPYVKHNMQDLKDVIIRAGNIHLEYLLLFKRTQIQFPALVLGA